MNIIKNRLKKCCTPTHAGNPGVPAGGDATSVPG